MSQFTRKTAQHELFAFVANLKICGRYDADAVARYAEDLAARDRRARMTEVISVAGLTGTRAQMCSYFGADPNFGPQD